MSWKFCNDDPRLMRNNVETIPYLTKEEFRNIASDYAEKHSEDIDFEDIWQYEDECEYDLDEDNVSEFFSKLSKEVKIHALAQHMMRMEEYSSGKFSKEPQPQFSSENMPNPEDPYYYYLEGTQDLGDGLIVYGITCGGDWEVPTYHCIYWDGKNMNVYTPRYGNTYNLVANAAFGSEQDGKNRDTYFKEWCRYVGIKPTKKEFKSDPYGYAATKEPETTKEMLNQIYNPDTYTKMYGKTIGVFSIYNADAIKQDIKAYFKTKK